MNLSSTVTGSTSPLMTSSTKWDSPRHTRQEPQLPNPFDDSPKHNQQNPANPFDDTEDNLDSLRDLGIDVGDFQASGESLALSLSLSLCLSLLSLSLSLYSLSISLSLCLSLSLSLSHCRHRESEDEERDYKGM